jgi:hypothetical protein
MSAASIPTQASVEAEIDAVTLSQGLAALEKLAASLGTSTTGASSGAVMKLEDLAAMIDPELIPVIGGIRKILPMLDSTLAMFEPATGSPWLGDPRLP